MASGTSGMPTTVTTTGGTSEQANTYRRRRVGGGPSRERTSSREAFLDAVSPALSIISSGPQRYGSVILPDADIVTLLGTYGLYETVARTDVHDDTCATNSDKVGTGNDNKPGGCDNVRVTMGGQAMASAYWMG